MDPQAEMREWAREIERDYLLTKERVQALEKHNRFAEVQENRNQIAALRQHMTVLQAKRAVLVKALGE